MKDLSTGKTHLTRRTKQVAGPAFAKAGYNVEKLVGKRQILKAWSATLTDAQADDLLGYVTGKSAQKTGAVEAAPSRAKLRLVR